jgi:DNA-binding NarL/FixJ family response regulator
MNLFNVLGGLGSKPDSLPGIFRCNPALALPAMNDPCAARIRVAGALGNPLMRQGIAACVAASADMEWDGDVGELYSLVEYCRLQAPDVVLIDLQLRTPDGLTLIQEIRRASPATEVVALSAFNSETQARAALKAGAKGFLHKDAKPEELAETIRVVREGKLRLPPAVMQLLVRSLSNYELSVREIEVLRLVAEFSATKVIATRMSISEQTVKVHVKHILEKMGARDRTHAVVMGIRQGLIVI